MNPDDTNDMTISIGGTEADERGGIRPNKVQLTRMFDISEFPPDSEMEAMGLTKDSPIEEFMEKLKWGTYGVPSRLPIQNKYLSDLETDHLQNLLISQRQIPLIYSKAILGILRNDSAVTPLR